MDEGLIPSKSIAPSYFLEGLLYNVPNEHFGTSYEDTIINSVNWIRGTDRSKFVCSNEQYYLFGNWAETWPVGNYDQFMNAFVKYWQDWS